MLIGQFGTIYLHAANETKSLFKSSILTIFSLLKEIHFTLMG